MLTDNMYGSNSDDPEMDDTFNDANAFSDKIVRLGFIRKVFGILSVQLIVTMCIMSLFIFIDEVKWYSINNQWIWITAFVATIIILIVLACCSDVRRQYPLNLILLGGFTICEGILLGSVASHYRQDSVLMAVGITAVVAVGLTLFAFQTKWDFTMMGGMLFVFAIVLFCFGIFTIFLYNRILALVYSSLGALLFSAYLVFDVQLMLGGKHKYSISPEEYIFASLNLYLDIINLFMFILSIIGNARN